MQKFFRTHTESALVGLAIILLAILATFFSWGIGDVVSEVNRALKFTPSEVKTGFDMQTASKLDLRGLLDQSSTTTQ